MRVLTSTSYENGTLTLNFTNQGEVPAGTPFILKWENDGRGNIKNPYFEYVTIPANVEAGKTPTTYADFIGSFSPVDLEGGDRTVLYLGTDDKLYYPSEAMTVNSARGYFVLNGITAGDIAETRLLFDAPSGATAPTAPAVFDGGSPSAFYTIDGRRLSAKPAQKGVYIHKGRKVIVK